MMEPQFTLSSSCLPPPHEIVVPNSGRWGGQSRTVDRPGLRRLLADRAVLREVACAFRSSSS
jgi:hypothetical protein